MFKENPRQTLLPLAQTSVMFNMHSSKTEKRIYKTTPKVFGIWQRHFSRTNKNERNVYDNTKYVTFHSYMLILKTSPSIMLDNVFYESVKFNFNADRKYLSK